MKKESFFKRWKKNLALLLVMTVTTTTIGNITFVNNQDIVYAEETSTENSTTTTYTSKYYIESPDAISDYITVDGKKYICNESLVNSGIALGTEVTIADKSEDDAYQNYELARYINENLYPNTVLSVAPDGSTVLYQFYDLKPTYTVNYYLEVDADTEGAIFVNNKYFKLQDTVVNYESDGTTIGAICQNSDIVDGYYWVCTKDTIPIENTKKRFAYYKPDYDTTTAAGKCGGDDWVSRDMPLVLEFYYSRIITGYTEMYYVEDDTATTDYIELTIDGVTKKYKLQSDKTNEVSDAKAGEEVKVTDLSQSYFAEYKLLPDQSAAGYPSTATVSQLGTTVLYQIYADVPKYDYTIEYYVEVDEADKDSTAIEADGKWYNLKSAETETKTAFDGTEITVGVNDDGAGVLEDGTEVADTFKSFTDYGYNSTVSNGKSEGTVSSSGLTIQLFYDKNAPTTTSYEGRYYLELEDQTSTDTDNVITIPYNGKQIKFKLDTEKSYTSENETIGSTATIKDESDYYNDKYNNAYDLISSNTTYPSEKEVVADKKENIVYQIYRLKPKYTVKYYTEVPEGTQGAKKVEVNGTDKYYKLEDVTFEKVVEEGTWITGAPISATGTAGIIEAHASNDVVEGSVKGFEGYELSLVTSEANAKLNTLVYRDRENLIELFYDKLPTYTVKYHVEVKATENYDVSVDVGGDVKYYITKETYEKEALTGTIIDYVADTDNKVGVRENGTNINETFKSFAEYEFSDDYTLEYNKFTGTVSRTEELDIELFYNKKLTFYKEKYYIEVVTIPNDGSEIDTIGDKTYKVITNIVPNVPIDTKAIITDKSNDYKGYKLLEPTSDKPSVVDDIKDDGTSVVYQVYNLPSYTVKYYTEVTKDASGAVKVGGKYYLEQTNDAVTNRAVAGTVLGYVENANGEVGVSVNGAGTDNTFKSYDMYQFSEAATKANAKYSGTVSKDGENVIELFFDDLTAPTGEITITTNKWNCFLDTINFDLLFKDNVDVTITADDVGLGVAKVEYLLSDTVLDADTLPSEGWIELTASNSKYTFNITSQNKCVVYARITDKAGNVTVINSVGIVIYQDSEAVATTVTYKYKEGSDKDVEVELNGNTVKSIVCGETSLVAGTDYSVSDNNITIKGAYLDKLNTGDYSFTVFYNPLGVDADEVELKTTFTVKVEPIRLTVKSVTAKSRDYDETNKVDIISVTLDGIKNNDGVSIEVTNLQGTVSSANVGTYTSVTLPALTLTNNDNGNYTLVQPTESVTVKDGVEITRADADITVGTNTYNKTFGDAAFTLDVADTNPEANVQYEVTEGIDVVSVSDGAVTILKAGTAVIKVTLPESANYNAMETTICVTVSKAENAPNKPDNTKSVPYSNKTVREITLPEGWAWQDADKDIPLEAGVSVNATAVYTGTDKGNYETESVLISITRQLCTHAGKKEVKGAKEASCGAEGYTGDTYCKDCGTKIATGIVIEKKTHNYGEPIFKWAEDGKTCTVTFTCKTDTAHTETNNAKVTAEVKTAATCKDKGVTTYTASYTEESKAYTDSKDVQDIPATGHTGGTATCTKKAVCTICQQEYGELDTTNHGETEVRDIKAATCGAEGYAGDTYCKDCGIKVSTGQVIAKSTVHAWNTGTVTKEPTATEAGTKTYTCTICGAIQKEEIPVLGGSAEDNTGSDNTGSSNTGNESTVNGYTTLEAAEKTLISTNTDKGDVKGSAYAKLRLKATGKKKSVKLTWQKVKDADGYIVYGGRCGSSMKKLKTIKGSSKVTYTHTKLKQGKYYKYMVVAYKTVKGKKCIITSSKTAHVVTTGDKYANPIKITVKSSKITIKKGKKATIKATCVVPEGKKFQTHIAKLRYESSNTKVATVSKTGVVTAKKKGIAYIYVYAQNGIYKKVKITVK